MTSPARILITVFLFFFALATEAQTVFWTETFNNGCTAGCLANTLNTGNGAWSIDNTGGCNDTYSNKWFVSCAENGNAVTTCGTGCGSNATLHIGADDGFFYDIGASYDAGGFGGCGFGGTYTYTRAVSPLISTSGKSGISVSFDYLEFGATNIDDGWVDYSTDGGTSWTLLINTVKTNCCGGACNGFRQGKWGNYTSANLPAAADNNPNFRIRFVWTNNDDGAGTDPSFAINDLKIRYTTVLPIEMLSFDGVCDDHRIRLNWSTATEINNDFFTVERSTDGEIFSAVGVLDGAGNSGSVLKYSFLDNDPAEGTNYYRIVQTDFNGQFTTSEIIAVNGKDCAKEGLSLVSAWFSNGALEIDYKGGEGPVTMEVYSIDGKLVRRLTDLPRESKFSVEASGLVSSLYFIRISDGTTTVSQAVQKQDR
ncbi:MAG TPA: hypothetical protein VL651_14880 [Bacteroidia bacterium]|nr:hypothetical protein [Bacteroidia bacterium]